MEENINLQKIEELIKDIENYGYIDAHLGKQDDYEIDSILYYLKDYQKLEKENTNLKEIYLKTAKFLERSVSNMLIPKKEIYRNIWRR